MTSPWIFDRNLILQAGAGTGKTHALVTLALHLLSGATQRRAPVPASRLVALTFTDKAAAEMRNRLLERLAPLAEGKTLAECDNPPETELIQSFATLGIREPTAAEWRRVQREVPQATIGTFHAFCGTQLRRLAGRAPLAPDFEVMDEEDARDLFDNISRDRILALLAGRHEGATALVDEFGLTNDIDTGLIELVRSILARISEEGRSPISLDDGRFSDARAAADFSTAVTNLRASIEGFNALDAKHLAKLAAPIARMRGVADRLTRDNVDISIAELVVARKTPFRKPNGDAGAPVTVFDDRLQELKSATAGLRIAPLGRAFVAIAADVEQHYSDAKRTRNKVDFADLQRMLRDLLRDDLETRGVVKSRFDALLVDEFQDTSRLQFDLVRLLAESRAEELPEPRRYEPGLLCIVGDRKQSIYEFRGADVAVFSRASTELKDPARSDPPAQTKNLTDSWRSRPALVNLANTLFRRMMATAAEPFEIAFNADDGLNPKLAERPSGPLAEVIAVRGSTADERRSDEATCIAARIDDIVNGRNPVQVRSKSVNPGESRWRPAEGRDIAILFRSLSNLNVYRDELAKRGIAHVVVGGSGFYGTREVLDCWALLRCIDDPADPVASIALLRSPWCSLSDTAITRLSIADGKFSGVTIKRLLETPATVDDQGRLDVLLDFLRDAIREFDRIGARETLRRALAQLDYLAVVAALPESDAAGANVEKLLTLLGRFESRAITARGAVRLLTERIREPPREPEAASAEESDPRSVRLMTIHQAKGLEFPIVFLPDCVWSNNKESSPVAYERDLGLGFSVRQGDTDERQKGPRLQAIRDRLNARSGAEDLRLLYVAITRARDYLVITGASGEGFAFDSIAALGREHVRVVEIDREAQTAHGRWRPALPTRAIGSVAPGVTPVRSLSIRRVVTTVSRLRDFAECPERYRLRHEIGMIEPGTKPEPERMSAATLGQLAHKLLKLAEFKQHGDAALDDLIRAEGVDPQRPEVMDMRRNIRAILETPAAMTLRELPPARRLQEVPFQLAIATDGGRIEVKGQIDLLTLGEEGVRVYDYKLNVAETLDPEAHLFQLTTYGVAAREMIHGSPLPVQAGIMPLLSPDAAVQSTPLSPVALDAHVEELRELGSSLIESLSTRQWSKLPVESCHKLKCGFIPRCHGS